MAKRNSNASVCSQEPDYVYKSNPSPYKIKKGEYRGLKGNSDIDNSMNKDNMGRYVNAFVLHNLRGGNIKLNREYRNRTNKSEWIDRNKTAVRS